MRNTIIFDFDGVLLDSFPDQFRWFQHICQVLGKPFPYSSLDHFRGDYREPVYPDMYAFLGFNWNGEKDTIWREYREYKAQSKINLFDGVEEVVRSLHGRGRRLAIASSNTHEAIQRQLQEYGLHTYFDVVVGKDDLPVHNGEPLLKPHPACLLVALEKLGCSPVEAMYVGDQPSDIIAAGRVAEYKGCSLPIVVVTYGYSPKEKLMGWHPEMLAHSPGELLSLLTEN